MHLITLHFGTKDDPLFHIRFCCGYLSRIPLSLDLPIYTRPSPVPRDCVDFT